MKRAYYYAGTRNGRKVACLVIEIDTTEQVRIEFAVSSKAQARELAVAAGAKPWNF